MQSNTKQKKPYKKAEQEILNKVYTSAKSAMVQQGLLEDETILDESARQKEKEIRLRFYHNTNKLLEGYSRMVKCIKHAPEILAAKAAFYEWEEDVDKLVDIVRNDCHTSGISDCKSVLKKIQLDKAMIDEVHHALRLLELMPGRKTFTGKEMADYIKKAYIYEDPQEMARKPWEDRNESRAWYYKRMAEAKNEFAKALWGNLDPEFRTAYMLCTDISHEAVD